MLASCLLASVAHAYDQPSLGVDVRDCGSAEGVRAIVALELDAHALAVSEVPAHATRVTAHCDSELAVLEVTDPLTRKTVSRVIGLEHVDQRARLRVLAIAIAELVSASWFELAQRPRVRASEPAAAVKERGLALRVVREREALWQWSVGAGPALTTSSSFVFNAAYGATLQLFTRSPRDDFLWHVEVSGLYGREAHPSGAITTSELTVGFLGLVNFQLTEMFGFQLGGGLRGAAGKLRGDADDPSQVRDRELSGAYGGVVLAFGGSVELGHWGSVRLLHQGYFGSSLQANIDGEPAAALGGISILHGLSLHLNL